MSTVDAMVSEVSDSGEVTVDFRGVALKIPANIEDFPLEVMEAFEQERYVSTCRELLGPVQWAAVKALRLKLKDLTELVDVCFNGVGIETKNSES